MLWLGGALLADRTDFPLETLVITGRSGLPIPAIRIRPPQPHAMALLLHGVSASKETLVLAAEALAGQGYDCLMVDFPGHGTSSLTFGAREDLIRTATDAAHFLSPDAPLDLVVGHSMGAHVAAEVLADGQLKSRRFVAVGAAVDPGPVPTLYLAGRWDEVVGGEALQQLSHSGPNRQWWLSPSSDHVLEPFDPLLLRRITGHSLGPAGLWRLLGIASLGAGFLILLVALLPRPATRARKFALGAGIAFATWLTFAVGFGSSWLSAWPTAARIPVALVSGCFGGLGLGALTGMLGFLPLLRRCPATVAHLLVALGAGLLVPALTVVGQAFAAMCFGWCVVVFLGAALLVGVVELRSRSTLAAVVASAGFLGCFFAEWIPRTF